MNWEIINKSQISSIQYLVSVLLENRGLKTEKEKEEFFDPKNPLKISIKSLNVNEADVKKAIDRIKKAKKNKDQVIVYGDYDADGITATAIMWEALHNYGLDVLPHIPDRFEEGYGINSTSVENLKFKKTASYDGKNLKLIVTVDNGIVAYEGIKKAKELGIDVIVIDHHTKGTKKLNTYAQIHSTQVSGSGLAWFFAKELDSSIKYPVSSIMQSLELAAIGTIADQLPLTDINRSIVKYGLAELNKTKRPGLLALFEEAGISSKKVGPLEQRSDLIKSVGTYEVGYIIAPRINAMGRLKHGIESLRLLCTKDKVKALDIAKNIGETNLDRQKVVEQVVLIARKNVTDQKIIVIAGENYHEGVIGLAAGRLVEEFYRPSIVLSTKGEVSKASARSVSGFNIIDAIRAVNLHSEGGGHPMAAGFSIATDKIPEFTKEINKYADKLLTDEILQKKLKIDCEIDFNLINYDLYAELEKFNPTGLGNFTPLFCSRGIKVVSVKPVGRENKHLKMKLEKQGDILESIYFGGGEKYSNISTNSRINIVYTIEENVWNNHTSLQLKVKDIEIV